MTFRLPFDLASIRFRCHFDFASITSVPLRCLLDFLRVHFGIISMPLRFHFGSTLTTLQFHFEFAWGKGHRLATKSEINNYAMTQYEHTTDLRFNSKQLPSRMPARTKRNDPAWTHRSIANLNGAVACCACAVTRIPTVPNWRKVPPKHVLNHQIWNFKGLNDGSRNNYLSK